MSRTLLPSWVFGLSCLFWRVPGCTSRAYRLFHARSLLSLPAACRDRDGAAWHVWQRRKLLLSPSCPWLQVQVSQQLVKQIGIVSYNRLLVSKGIGEGLISMVSTCLYSESLLPSDSCSPTFPRDEWSSRGYVHPWWDRLVLTPTLVHKSPGSD